MNCLEFRRAAGADPQHLSSDAEAHARECPACARYLAEIVELDVRVLRALSVPVPAVRAQLRIVPAPRRRIFALAASVLIAVGIGAAGWLVLVPESLASDVVEHMRGEPDSWGSKTVATNAALETSMQRGDAWFTTMPGQFVYVQSCWFRGHYVPHLVLETADGPVTLMLLRHEKVKAETPFNEGGYQGMLLPVEDGSVAVVTHGTPLAADLAAHIASSIQWIAR